MEDTLPTQISNQTTISTFLDRYRDFSNRLERQKIIHYKAKFNGLFNGYDTLRNVITIFNAKDAVNYNIFDILNIKTAETKTHTPFLNNLLRPDGTHGQSDLFLSSFIQKFIPEVKRDYFILWDKNEYQIQKEKPIRNGRIDIYIQSVNPKKKFSLIIENKLFAGDQYLQLSRYYDFMKGRRYEDQQMIMFYLTIDGNDPPIYSLDQKISTDLKKRNILHTLSYKRDIKNWLDGIRKDIKAKKVKLIVEQYLEIINQF